MIQAGIFFIGVCLAAAVCGEAIAHEPPSGLKAANSPPGVRRAFELVQHDGQNVTDRTFHGKTLLVMFGFASCDDVCPMGLSTISKAAEHLERAGIDVTPVFISVDPDRDTLPLLGKYVKNFHPRMVALTGSRKNISNATAAFGVQFGVRKSAETYYVWHSSETFLVGPRGDLLATFTPYATADAVVTGARNAIAKRKPVARATIGE